MMYNTHDYKQMFINTLSVLLQHSFVTYKEIKVNVLIITSDYIFLD